MGAKDHLYNRDPHCREWYNEHKQREHKHNWEVKSKVGSEAKDRFNDAPNIHFAPKVHELTKRRPEQGKQRDSCPNLLAFPHSSLPNNQSFHLSPKLSCTKTEDLLSKLRFTKRRRHCKLNSKGFLTKCS